MLPPERAAGGVALTDLLGSAHAEVPGWTGLRRLTIAGSAPAEGSPRAASTAASGRPAAASGRPAAVAARPRTWIEGVGGAGTKPDWVAALTDPDAWVEVVRRAGTAAWTGDRPLVGIHARALASAREGALGDLRLLREDHRRPRPLATVAPVHHGAATAGRRFGIAFVELLRLVDLFGRFVAAAPRSVAAEVQTSGGPAALVIAVTYADGALATARLHDGEVGALEDHRFELVGLTARFAAEEVLDVRPEPEPGPAGATPTWLAPLARAVWAGEDEPAAPASARRALRIAWAATAAIGRGRPVRLDPRP